MQNQLILIGFSEINESFQRTTKLESIHTTFEDHMVFEEIELLDDLSNNEITIIEGIY